MTISGRPLEVIGVAPAQAFEWDPVDLYIPMHLARTVDFQSRVQHGLKIFGSGLAIGILSTLVLSRYIQSLMFGVSSNDPISFGLAIFVLAVTGLLACLLPAIRAMRTDPITVLKK